MSSKQENEGLDLIGLGKLAKAIPPEVYVRATESILANFEKLAAPITETTHGFGRFIKQKFDSMIAVEKALATYTLERAVEKAKARAAVLKTDTITPTHPKSFIKSLEEASQETDPLLHELWSSLLASQLLEGSSHPHFVHILNHFSPEEARLLPSLREWESLGDHGGVFISYNIDQFSARLESADDKNPKPWTSSCTFLCEFRLADVVASKSLERNPPPILYRTNSGSKFLQAVTI